MHKPFTHLLKLMLLALALGKGFTSQGQVIPQPVAITAASFTADIVANGNSQTVNGTTFGAADAVSNFFPSVDFTTTATPNFFHPTIGLPTGRSFLSSGTPNVLFNLQTYGTTPPSAGNYNSLRLYGATSGTLTFDVPQTASTIYVLATCGSGPDAGTFTINFSDNTTQSFARAVPDWFNGTLANGTTVAYNIGARVSAGSTNFDNQLATSNPRLYQIVLPLSAANLNKLITGVTYTKTTTATQTVQLMGVSAAPAATYTPMSLTFPATGTAPAPVSNAFATPTAYGQDVIANGTGQTTAAGSASSATADTDGGGYYLMSTDYNSNVSAHPTIGLPFAGINGVTTTGLIPSLATPGLNFQLADYSGINALQIRGATNAAVVLNTPTAASEAFVLIEPVLLTGTTASGTITVTFSDATTHAFPVTYTNWYTATPTSPASVAYNMLGRLNGGTSNTVNTSGNNAPYLLEVKLTLSGNEVGKAISSIRVASASANTIVSVLGVSLNTSTSCSATIASGLVAATNTATACASTTLNLTVNGIPAQAGYSYQWEYNANNAGWLPIPTTNATGPLSANATSASCLVTNQQVATQYRCQVTCPFDGAGGTPSPSAPVAVGQTDFINCYCYPAVTANCGTYGTVTGVSINNGSGLSQTGLSCPSNPYSSYGVVLPSTATGTLDKASTTGYTLSVAVSNATRIAAWLDVNRNGTFEASEYLTFATPTATGGTTFTGTIPPSLLAAAGTGNTGLRIRTERNTTSVLATAGNSCSATTNGQTLDYTIKIANVAPCAGTPTATTPTQFPAGAMCAGSTFTLTATGPEIDAGTTNLTYQWEYKLSAVSTWAPVPASLTATDGTVVTTNATTGVCTITNQREATDYRVTITCASAGGGASTSPLLTVAQTPFVSCYCQPTAASVADYITNVTLQDINNPSGNSTTTPLLGYADYTASPTATQTTTLNAGATYAITVAGQSSTATSSQMVWIDYDHSGTFDDNEYTSVGSGSPSGALSRTTNISVPSNALLGATHMRVRWHNIASANNTSCDTGWNGETEEYLVTIAPEVVCSTPTALTVSSLASAPCSGATFTLTASGATAGQSGLTYQWEKSTTGPTGFAPISGATSLSLTTSQTASTDYRIVTTCANGGASTPSNTVSVTMGYLNCYCTPSSTPTNEYVSAVTMTGSTPFTNSTGGTSNTSTGYNNYTGNSALTTTLNQGGTYPVTVSIRANASPSQAALWIDFDHSGTFDPTDNVEYYLLGTPATGGNYTYTINVTVPATAPLGPTRMRVRERNSLFANTAGCDASGYGGETEDYLITVGPPLQCTNPPATITATADVTNACTNAAFTLSTTSIPAGTTGFTFQWQSRATGSGNAFADITGATTFSYSVIGQTVPTDYQLVVGCANGGTPVTSNTVAVGQNTYDQCYCSVVHGAGCSAYGAITNVSINGMSNGTACAGAQPNYTVVPAATATTTLTAGLSYTLSTTFASSPSISAGVWVDYNHNGTFDINEFSSITNSAGSGTLNTSMTVPTTALAGTTRMRIRTESTGVALVTASRGCDTFVYGETEDYILTVASPLPVKLISFTAAAQAAAVRLDWATASELRSERFEVERSTDGKTFERIGTVAAQGSSTHRADYEFLDNKALAKATTRYYRLRQVDTDGAAEYSPIRSVQAGSTTRLELYPNPAHRNLSVTGAAAGAAVEIFDALGRSVLTAPADADGQARLTLPAGLPSGVYIVRSGNDVRRLTVE